MKFRSHDSDVRLKALKYFGLGRQTSLGASYTVQRVFYYTGLFEIIVVVLTTCHTQYTLDRSICFFYLIEQHSKFLLHAL